MRFAILITMALVGVQFVASAETIRVHVGEPPARMRLLKPGVHRYLRYNVKPDGSRSVVDIWERRISLEDQGRSLHIVQRWDEADGKAVLIQDSIFDARNFAPSTHIRHIEQGGKTSIGGYLFASGKVVGMPDLADNSRKDFLMPMPEASFNFEYDMELLQTLPLASGKTFDIPFYDAGIDKKPDRWAFVVAGSALIVDWTGRPIDCWVVTADYHTGKVASRFWFAKQGQVLVREEAQQDDGSLLVKTLLPPESADKAFGAST